MQVLRSFLFCPGNHARRVEKAFQVGADAVILDLEDAVAKAEKVATRPLVAQAMRQPRRCRGYIRINSIGTEFCFGDLAEVVRPGLDGIILPMAESAQHVWTVDWLLKQLEREHGIEAGTIDLIPIIETGAGLAAIAEIARAGTRVRRIAFGAGDFTLDMNLRWSRDENELYHARASIVLASRAAGLEPPFDTVWTDLRDPEGFATSAHTAVRLGFQGKMCIHPDQVPVVNRAFSPAAEDVERARRIVAAFEKAEAEGLASIQVDGQFVDYPIVYRAQRVLALAERTSAADTTKI